MTTKNFISLGAGVQSSTMALMAAHGEIEPMPDAAVFADTQDEPMAVYKWLDWLEKQLPFPTIRVTRGKLSDAACRVRTSKTGLTYTKHSIPLHCSFADGNGGNFLRACTQDFKLQPLFAEYRRRRERSKVVSWVGISLDEATRMRPSRQKWMENRWPLIELRMTRADCLKWIAEKKYPTPSRSSCVFCPYHNNREWQEMKAKDPTSFAAAVAFEQRFQAAMKNVPRFRATPFLHRSCIPLDQVDFVSNADRDQLNLFENECEGMCGV